MEKNEFVSVIGVAVDVFFYIKLFLLNNIEDFRLRVIDLSENISVETELIHWWISQLWIQYTILNGMVNVCATTTIGTYSWHFTPFSIVDT